MTWREDLRRVSFGGRQFIGASFRGVPFFVESSERTGGRRVVVHKFPFNPNPFVEDLDRDARTFRIDGYVLGDDYFAQKNALLVALEDTAGPGELVHPYHGVRRAICGPMSVRETRADGGMAVFSIEFHEAPTQAPTPTEVVDLASRASASADVAVAAARAELVEKFDPVGMPAFALASAETVLRNMSAGLESRLARVAKVTQEAATMTSQVRILTSQASSLVRQPGEAFDAFRSAITGLATTIADAPDAVVAALSEVFGTDAGLPVVAGTATRERELANQVALTSALRRVAAIEAARLVPLGPHASIDEALAARDRVAGMLEAEAAIAGDTAYPALVTLRSDVLRAVPGAGVSARVVKVTRRVPIPSLLLAYQLYGSVDQEADVIARNKISHPGFVAGELEVISDA